MKAILGQELVLLTTAVFILGGVHLRVRFFPRQKSGVCIQSMLPPLQGGTEQKISLGERYAQP